MSEKLSLIDHKYKIADLFNARTWDPSILEGTRLPTVKDCLIDLAWAWRDRILRKGFFRVGYEDKAGNLKTKSISLNTIQEALWTARMERYKPRR